jgi:hypothetical protein
MQPEVGVVDEKFLGTALLQNNMEIRMSKFEFRDRNEGTTEKRKFVEARQNGSRKEHAQRNKTVVGKGEQKPLNEHKKSRLGNHEIDRKPTNDRDSRLG